MDHTHLLLFIRPEGLGHSHVVEATALLLGYGIETGTPRWLGPGEACEVPLTGEIVLPETLRAWAGHWRCDMVVVPVEGRRKKLLVADMESTLIEQELLDVLARRVGRESEVAAITERAMRGELDFAEAFRARAALLKGVSRKVFEEIASEITLMPGATTLIRTMQAHGAKAAIVSSGLDYFVKKVAARLGCDAFPGNALDFAGDQLSGIAHEPIRGRADKLAALRAASDSLGGVEAAIAVGDGANDLDMLTALDFGVAFRAKPAVAQTAPMSVAYGDLSSLLYIQGYEVSEFVQ